MTLVSAFIVFIMIWWMVFFCVLPIGQATKYEPLEPEEAYRAPGAPKMLNMKKKLVITTVTTIILFLIIYFIIDTELIDFREIAKQG